MSRLATCHRDLQRLAHRAVRGHDCTVIEGARSIDRQVTLFLAGLSKRDGVNKRSRHQVSETQPLSLAVDLAPWYSNEEPNIPWSIAPLRAGPNCTEDKARNNLEHLRRWYGFGGYVLGIAAELGIPIRWGGDWDGDWTHSDQQFHDLPHFELMD
jgi:hypothetical protein